MRGLKWPLAFLLILGTALPGMAVPIIAGNFLSLGLNTSLPSTTGGTPRASRPLDFFTTVNDLAATLNVSAASLSGLGTLTKTHGSAIYQTFTNVQAGDSIVFNANRQQGTNIFGTGGVQFSFFTSVYDESTAAGSGTVTARTVLAAVDSYAINFTAAGTYTVGFGIVRTNPTDPIGLGAYGLTANYANITPVGTPELDPRSATVPLALCGGLLVLLVDRRRLIASVS